MKIGKDGIDLIKSFESCAKKRADGHFDAYMPTKNDVPTIGWGSTKGIKMGMTLTQQECDDRFADEIAEFSTGVAKLVGTAKTTQNQFEAMVSLAYNIGIGTKGFAGSSVLKRHLEGNFEAAATRFGLWNKQAGKDLKGLTRRRAAEATLFRG